MSTRLLSSLSSVLSSPSLPFSLISLFVLLVLVLHLWRLKVISKLHFPGLIVTEPTLVRGPGVWRLQFGPWLWEEGHLTCFPVRCRLGPLFSMQLGPHFTLVVNSYDLAKEVLLTRGRDFAGRPKMVLPVMQYTLRTADPRGKDIAFCDYSALWKSHRRLVHSALSLFGEGGRLQDIGKFFVPPLSSSSSSSGNAFDPSAAVTRAVTNVVCTLVFSATYRRDDAELKEVIDYNNGIVETIARGGLVDLFPWLQRFPSRSLTKLKQCITVRDRLLQRKLDQHKASLSDGDGGIDPRDLLEALLRGQEGQKSEVISDDHVLMTAAETFGAGVETTSTTLLWIIAYMLHHPEVQARAQRELEEQVGLERPVRLSDRTRLPYVEAVIQEGLRIRPVSPVLIPHTALTRTSLGGHPVQPGTRVLVNMWALHHNPTDWPQPDLFKPERFLDGRGGRVSPSCFLPFGAGPRVCVGESLARLELFLFLSSLLQRISFSLPPAGPVPDLRGRLGVVLQPPPYLVVATPRHT
uniref:Cytochrome P450, family 17, subfamily A, polypeptide 2 n=1 Tax=Neogobius melanostomus TaxID=47308 RepID=A0A8C6UN25_9GOBI